jgi:hypothetical protein
MANADEAAANATLKSADQTFMLGSAKPRTWPEKWKPSSLTLNA